MSPIDLVGHRQRYTWGSATEIPALLGEAADGDPWAEQWYGTHPLAPNAVASGGTLEQLIAADPEAALGADVARAFGGSLPYLLKIIAAERPLSLQVHPTREHATESFDAENASGLPLDSPRRTYRDGNHKPEMLLALTRFTALCGFRTPRRAAALCAGLGTDLTDRLHRLLVATPTAHGMRAALRTLLSAALRPDPAAVQEVVAACRARAESGASPSPRIDRFVCLLAEHHPGDPGVVAALLLNPVTLQPGEALFVPPGALHAYLQGTGLEIMASSDNVLRAGLTAKKVDAYEVLQCVSVAAAPPLRVAPERQSPTSIAYYAPVDDFELSVTELPAPGGEGPGEASLGEPQSQTPPPTQAQAQARTPPQAPALVPGSGPRILLGLSGEVTLHSPSGEHLLPAGGSVFVPAADGPLRASGVGRFAQASVP